MGGRKELHTKKSSKQQKKPPCGDQQQFKDNTKLFLPSTKDI